MLEDAGLDRQTIRLNNVLSDQPPNNDLEAICVSKADALAMDSTYCLPALSSGKYLHPGLSAELPRLVDDIRATNPNLVLAMGNVATWALLGTSGIKKIRGTISPSSLIPGLKVLPTYHPAYILRAWPERVVALADLMKAKREMAFPDLRYPKRTIYVPETLGDVAILINKLLFEGGQHMAIDIETARGMILCIGFSTTPEWSAVFPFADKRKPGYSYWPDLETEFRVRWDLRDLILRSPLLKVYQNGAYDTQYQIAEALEPANWTDDTMLIQHALFPELPKGLDFLGSIHTNERAWKLMRHRADDLKRDE